MLQGLKHLMKNEDRVIKSHHLRYIFFLQGRFYLENRQKPTDSIIYTTYIPPPPIINTFSDVKISKLHVHQSSEQ